MGANKVFIFDTLGQKIERDGDRDMSKCCPTSRATDIPKL